MDHHVLTVGTIQTVRRNASTPPIARVRASLEVGSGDLLDATCDISISLPDRLNFGSPKFARKLQFLLSPIPYCRFKYINVDVF